MTAPTASTRSLTPIDERITAALATLRRARSTAARSRTPEASRAETRAEENLNALLEYRRAVRERTAAPGNR